MTEKKFGSNRTKPVEIKYGSNRAKGTVIEGAFGSNRTKATTTTTKPKPEKTPKKKIIKKGDR